MNAPMGACAGTPDDVAEQLAFYPKLQQVSNRIHATAQVEEIMLDLGLDFSGLLERDRFSCTPWTLARSTCPQGQDQPGIKVVWAVCIC
jgi:hypothetical protein